MSHSSPSYYPAADQPARQAHHERSQPPPSPDICTVPMTATRSRMPDTRSASGLSLSGSWSARLVIMAVWSIATGTYFAFRDNVLTRLIGRQAEMQFAYEDRIAELRAQVDRIMSRQLLDQEQFEQKLNTLLQRQSTLEQRASALTGDPFNHRLGQAGAHSPPRPCPRLKSRHAHRRSTTQ